MPERIKPRFLFVVLPVLLVLAMVALLIAVVARPLVADLRALAIGARLRIESLAGKGNAVQLLWGDANEPPVPD